MMGWLFRLIARVRRRAPVPAPAREGNPEWLKDEAFMEWIHATMPGEFNLVDGWDWSRDRADDSMIGSAVRRFNWRREGWLGCGTWTALDEVPDDGPGHWWNDRAFITWHDNKYELEKWGTEKKTAQSIAEEIHAFAAENPHCTPKQLHNLNYDALKGLKRRWQGWCGMLQAVSNRFVCPECGTWHPDDSYRGEKLTCGGMKNEWQKCEHAWEPKWP